MASPSATAVECRPPRPVIVARYTALYDEQCEFCQAFVSRLRALDRKGLVDCVPIGADPSRIAALGLDLEACLRELHVVAPDGRISTGWDAVARLARLFPSTWLIGALGSVPPFRQLLRVAYRFVATHRYCAL